MGPYIEVHLDPLGCLKTPVMLPLSVIELLTFILFDARLFRTFRVMTMAARWAEARHQLAARWAVARHQTRPVFDSNDRNMHKSKIRTSKSDRTLANINESVAATD